MTYRLSGFARCDLQEIARYLGKHSPTAAETTLEELVSRFELLGKQPSLGAPRNDLLEGLRHTVVRKYVIYYRSFDKGIEVLRVIHGSRDVDAIEFE